ncbi:MAG TPA: sigma-70 family RNA polymerase sigma factor [Verrucomicrobiae bacterium]|nr:sigma-70 family RNA polymerase sigma factor [Verrucomicrobiae bacterium]
MTWVQVESTDDWHMDLPPPDPTDAELLRRIAAGDAEAFGQLYDRTSRVLFSMARQILRNDAAAEDLLQDVYVQVWDRAGSFDESLGRPITWLITLTRNRAVDRLRASQRFERMIEAAQEESVLTSAGNAAVEPEMDGEQRRVIRAALNGLAAEQRQALDMAFFGGLTQSEIAEELKVPLGTVKARIRRGMLQLRDALKRFDLKS